MNPKLIYIDAGHGGTDPGAVGAQAREKDINLAVALQVGRELTQRGFAVCYSRTRDMRMTVAERARAANKAKAAAFVSIHCNSATNKAARGAETFAYSPASKGYGLAKTIQRNLVNTTDTPCRGTKTANFAVLRETAMPAALVELGFLSNKIDEQFLLDIQWQRKAATAIADAVAEYFSL